MANTFKNHTGNPESHGAEVRRKYKVVDAVQMAIQGYDLLFQLLPEFIALFIKTKSLDTACLFAYGVLLGCMDDTNILYKKGRTGLDYAQSKVKELLVIPCLQTRKQRALEIHRLFQKQVLVLVAWPI